MANYYYGATQINANALGLGYFLLSKDLGMVTYKPTTSPIARAPGVKKSGEQITERIINVKLRVVGTSRLDLMSRLDMLIQGLSQRQQTLVLHEDGRLFQNVDCTVAPVRFASGQGIVQCDIDCQFVAYDPFAYAASTSIYDTGNLTLTTSGSVYVSSPITLAAGGNATTYPTIRLTNNTPTMTTTLTSQLVSGHAYQYITVQGTTTPLYVGDTIYIVQGFYPSQVSQTLTISQNQAAGTQNLYVNQFVANATYDVGDTIRRDVHWTGVQIQDTTDFYTVSATIPSLVASDNGRYVDIRCNVEDANGWQIAPNGGNTLLEPVGAFPPLQPTNTTYVVTIDGASLPVVDVRFTWVNKWLN